MGNPLMCHREGRISVSISFLILQGIDYLNKKKEEDKKKEARDKESYKSNFKKIVWKENKNKRIVNCRLDPFFFLQMSIIGIG